MGTNTSVERFDGIRLEHYMVEGSNENLKRVFALVEMPGNELWLARAWDFSVWPMMREARTAGS